MAGGGGELFPSPEGVWCPDPQTMTQLGNVSEKQTFTELMMGIAPGRIGNLQQQKRGETEQLHGPKYGNMQNDTK